MLQRRLAWCLKVLQLDEEKKLELLASFHPCFSFKKKRRDGKLLFRLCCYRCRCVMGVMDRLTREELNVIINDKAKVNTLMDCLRKMVNTRKPLPIHVPPNDLGSALECFSLACGFVYAVFQFLQLQTDDFLLKRSSLEELLHLNAKE